MLMRRDNFSVSMPGFAFPPSASTLRGSCNSSLRHLTTVDVSAFTRKLENSIPIRMKVPVHCGLTIQIPQRRTRLVHSAAIWTLPPLAGSYGETAPKSEDGKSHAQSLSLSVLCFPGFSAVLALQPRRAGAMTQETRQDGFVDCQPLVRLFSQEAALMFILPDATNPNDKSPRNQRTKRKVRSASNKRLRLSASCGASHHQAAESSAWTIVAQIEMTSTRKMRNSFRASRVAHHAMQRIKDHTHQRGREPEWEKMMLSRFIV